MFHQNATILSCKVKINNSLSKSVGATFLQTTSALTSFMERNISENLIMIEGVKFQMHSLYKFLLISGCLHGKQHQIYVIQAR